MNAHILNTIIAFSLVGILAIGVRDHVYKPQTKANQYLATTITPTVRFTPKPTIELKDPKVDCSEHPFFPNQTGTAWIYTVDTQLTIKGESKRSSSTLTNEIVRVEDSEITIRSQVDNSKDTFETTLICRKSGIYGFPFVAIPEDLTKFVVSKIDLLGNLGFDLPHIQFDQNMLFVPDPNKLTVGSSWKSAFGVDLGLPVYIGQLSFQVTSKVVSESNKWIPGYKASPILTIESRSSKNQPENNNPPVMYELARGVGLVSLKADLTQEGMGSLKTSLRLTKFSPAVSVTLAPTSSFQ